MGLVFPPQGLPGIFPWFSSGVWAFLRAPFLGFLRGFVVLAHVVFYHVFWPHYSYFRLIDLSLRFCDFRLGFRYGAGSLGSPPIGVRSSEPSGSSFPGSTDLHLAPMGASLFDARRLYLDDGISSDFPSSYLVLGFLFRPPCPARHTSPCLCVI